MPIPIRCMAMPMANPGAMRAPDTASAVLGLDSPACEAWPWPLRAELQLRLTPQSLQLGLSVRNTGTSSMPAGIGFHPYFLHQPGARLRYHAARRLASHDAHHVAHPNPNACPLKRHLMRPARCRRVP